MPPFLRYAPLLALLLTLFTSGSSAQTLPPKITTFTSEEYKAHDQIFSTEALENGRRVFGTFGKILLYDGETFEQIPVREGKHAISVDRDTAGRLFIGGSSLMGMILPDGSGTPSYHSLKSLVPDSLKGFGNIWNTYCDPEGGVYFNYQGRHLFYYKRDSVKVIEAETRFFRLYHPGERVLIEDTEEGLFSLSGTHKEKLPGSETLVEEKGIRAILSNPFEEKGSWMVFTGTHGVYRYDPSKGNPVKMTEEGWNRSHHELKRAKIFTASSLDPSTNPYGAAYVVGTQLNGLYFLAPDGKILHQLGKDDGLPAELIFNVATDKAGNVWAMTNDGIALVHTGLPFTVAPKGGLFNGAVNDISRGPPQNGEKKDLSSPLFIATSQGTWIWQEEKESFSMVPGTESQCFSLQPYPLTDQRSKMLIAAGQSGFFSTDASIPEGQKHPSSGHRLKEKKPYAIQGIETSDGQGMIFGGRDGLHILIPSDQHPKNWEKIFSVEDVPVDIRTVAWERKEGDPDSLHLWAGMPAEGILAVATDTAFSGYRSTLYKDRGDLPEGSVRVFPFASDSGAKAFFGTKKGLYRFEGGGFVPACRFGRIFCKNERRVLSLKKGMDGQLWIRDEKGGNLKHLMSKEKGYRIDSTRFRSLDLGNVRSIFPEKDRVWLGSDEGLACYYPDLEVNTDRPWECQVREVRGSGDSLLFGGTFSKEVGERKLASDSTIEDRIPLKGQPDDMMPTLPYAKNRMFFTYGALFPTRQKAVRYRYKLAGFDTSWSKWTQKTEKEYTNLPEGSYTFKVKARNIYLKESSNAEYRFRILPPWYRTWTAYGTYSLAGIAFVWLLLWLNSRRLVAQKQRLESLVDERTKEIREQKELVEEEKQKVEEQQRETKKQKEKVEEAHEEITQSIDYAQKIQQALLQSEQQDATGIPEHFILFKPYSQVSGDFYWAKEHKGHFYIAAVDCTGHGVPGAFMSMLGISQLNEIMSTDDVPTPGEILTELRDRVVRELSGSDPETAAKDGMDAALLKVPITAAETQDPRSQIPNEEKVEVEFAGAQNPLYVIRKGIGENPPSASVQYQREEEVHVGSEHDPNPIRPFKKSSDGIEIKGDGQPVGYDEYAKEAFRTVKLQLRRGDMLYIFSDGYADQFGGPKGKKFRYGPFKQLLVGLHQVSLKEQKEELDSTFEDWKEEGQQEQIDDVVVVGVSL